MSFVIGGIAAIVALIAGIVGHVDPMASLGRAGIAFVVGVFLAQVWAALTQSTRMVALAADPGGHRDPEVATDGKE